MKKPKIPFDKNNSDKLLPVSNPVPNNKHKKSINIVPKAKFGKESIEEREKVLKEFKNVLFNMLGEQKAKSVLPEDKQDLTKQKPLDDKSVAMLRAMNSEYLKNFVVFGYDMLGERVIITSSKISEDKDSILEMSKNIPSVLHHMFNNNSLDI